jgi:TRAP-type C4-dicarboxylate transport system permease small subunit
VSHGGDLVSEPAVAGAAGRPSLPGVLGVIELTIVWINRAMVFFGMIALVVAALVLTYSVFSRYLFKAATDWQDEAAVFCIVGAVFLSGAYVQSLRGHIGIEAVASILPASVNRARAFVVDVMSFVFCTFFAWKSWVLWHEAWVDHMVTSSTWSPPLSIPYGLMAAGMTLLSVQILLQVATYFLPRTPPA